MLNIFENDAFSVVSMTAKVNKQPFVPGQIGATGIFQEEGVTTTTVMVEEMNGTLALVAPTPRGGVGETTDNEKRKVRAFPVPHYQRDDSVMADEVQGVRAFGAEGQASQVETVERLVESKMGKHTRALDVTLEHQRVGCLKGLITDKYGNTMFDLYQMYGLTRPDPIEFHLDIATTDVRMVCFDVIDQVEAALDGMMMSGLHAFCGNGFWKKLLAHKTVRETYLNTIQAAELRGNAHVFRFEFGGITFERYRTGTQATASANGPFFGSEEVRFIPVGVQDLFITRFAPADYEETVNTIGLPRYARQWRKENGKGRNMEVQMNAISICTRPEALLSGVSTNN
ncbi:major capsid protein [Methylobacterium nodulans]|uniref:Major capsid protein n=1 Tax=Methylobacterium nodulans (strain LMG 21967 / CNCM I-2342 / ORS 2060) TaxID=460265 RepID=B8ICL7_METNO|nr:major capsid protein [Methylobacterium nodulans]ACL57428.1 conserved hypothetical protein [Methylobacterium nodulans ORS 2060]